MHFFRRLRRFLAFVCLGAAGMLVLDGDPASGPATAPDHAAEQSFIGEESDGVAATVPTTAPPPAPAPEPESAPADEASARPLAEQNRALPTPTLMTGVPTAPIGAGIAVPLQSQPVVFELKSSTRRLTPERRVAELTADLFPAPPSLEAMRWSHTGLKLPYRFSMTTGSTGSASSYPNTRE